MCLDGDPLTQPGAERREQIRQIRLAAKMELAHERATMLVVTHEMQFARQAADRVYLIDQGRLVEVGRPEQAIDDPREPLTRKFLVRTRLAPAAPPAVLPAPAI